MKIEKITAFIVLFLLLWAIIPLTSIHTLKTSVQIQKEHNRFTTSDILQKNTFSRLPSLSTRSKPRSLNINSLAQNTQFFVNDTAVIGLPYYFPAIPQGSNITLNYRLETNKSYIGFILGFQSPNVDLDIWILSPLSSNQSEIIQFTKNHTIGVEDVIEFVPNATDTYPVVLYAHSVSGNYSYFGFALFEVYKTSFYIEEPRYFPLNQTPRYHTYYGVFWKWSKDFSDTNLTFSLNFTSKMTVDVSLYRFFTATDKKNYLPLDITSNVTVEDSLTVKSAEQGSLSVIIGPQELNWIKNPGCILFFHVIAGEGNVTFNFTASPYFTDSRFTTPIGVAQQIVNLEVGKYALFSYYMEKNREYDIILTSYATFGNKSEDLDLDLQVWRGGPLDAINGINNPKVLPLEYTTKKSNPDLILRFTVPTSGRYTIAVINDETESTTNGNAFLNVFFHWELAQTNKITAYLEGKDSRKPSTNVYHSYKAFFVKVNRFKGKNLTFQAKLPENLDAELRIFEFTSIQEQINYQAYSHEKAIDWKRGKKGNLITVSAEVGRRGNDRVNDTFWIVSLEAIRGYANLTITWSVSPIKIDLIQYGIAFSIIFLALVVVILSAWKLERLIS